MIRAVEERVWAFDLEWVPDPLAGRLLYGLPDSTSDADALAEMWRAGGATDEDPTPFLKTAVCRIVSIAVVERRSRGSDEAPTLNLLSLPRDPKSADESREANVIGTFLEALGKHRPQLVGYNSHDSDLKKLVGGFGKAVPSLHELAVQCGIPGKMDVDGNDVAAMWLDGRIAEIVAYNEFDALTTYLVWLRMAHFSGLFSTDGYAREQGCVRALIEREIAGGAKPHLARYLEEWERLRAATGER